MFCNSAQFITFVLKSAFNQKFTLKSIVLLIIFWFSMGNLTILGEALESAEILKTFNIILKTTDYLYH